MTQAIMALSGIRQPRFGAGDAGRWAIAAAIVIAGHMVVAYAVQSLSFAEPDGGSPPALAIEVSPLVVAPSPEETAMLDMVTEPPDAAEETDKSTELKPVTEPAPESVVQETEPVTEPPVETEKVEEASQAEPAGQTLAAPSGRPPLDGIVPDITETVAPHVVIPLPEPKPVKAEVKASKPVEAKKKTAEKKPVKQPKQRAKKEKAAPPNTVMTASIDTKTAAKAAAPQSADVAPRSSVSPSRWNSSLAVWIRRHTRYPGAARPRRAAGQADVTFTVDSSGRVVSARLARSSGDGDLDRAALGALQGASVPAPPAELGGRVTRTAPFVFSLRD